MSQMSNYGNKGGIIKMSVAETVINGVVGLAGAIIGGGASLWATNIQIKEQEKSDRDKVIEERKKASAIIETFLINEIQYNVEKMKWLEEVFKEGYDSPKIQGVDPYNELQFNEYENVKYKMIEINTIQSLKTIEIYQMFYMISKSRATGFRLNNFTKNEFNFIAHRYDLAKEMVEKHFEKKFQHFHDVSI